jgi:hypothetical protein
MRLVSFFVLFAAAGASSGCGLFGSNWERHYDVVRGVRPTVAASGLEARLEPPLQWPESSNRFLGRVLEVFSADQMAVRSDADGRVYRVRLSGAEVGGADDTAGAAKQFVSQSWLNREVVVEVPPRPDRQTEANQIWGHVVAEGRCLDALLIYQGYAKPREGTYPRRIQMRRAEEEAVGERGRFRPESDGSRPRPPGSPAPTPMPVPF